MSYPVWSPSSRHLEDSGPAQLVRYFGLPDYDALLRHALDAPAAYWRGVADLCEFVWDVPPDGYVDLARGREFPRWFPGARLN